MLTCLKLRVKALTRWQAGLVLACTFVTLLGAWALLIAFERYNARKAHMALWY